MKRSFMVFVGLGLIAGCGSNYKKPESFEEKMSRYKSQGLSANNVPKIKVLNTIDKNKMTQTRGPASQKKLKLGSYFLNQSNKRLYFLTLYNQYSELKKFKTDQSSPELNICPRFNSALVGHREKYGLEKSESKQLKVQFPFQSGEVSTETVALYPELSLPISSESDHPTLADMVSSKHNDEAPISIEGLLKKAVEVHLGKTYKELNELCEHGSSDNYYIYENLITYIKRQKGFRASPEGMQILLKTTLFSNMALINSFEQATGRSPASAAKKDKGLMYNEAVYKRLGVPWAKGYFREVRRKRYQ